MPLWESGVIHGHPPCYRLGYCTASRRPFIGKSCGRRLVLPDGNPSSSHKKYIRYTNVCLCQQEHTGLDVQQSDSIELSRRLRRLRRPIPRLRFTPGPTAPHRPFRAPGLAEPSNSAFRLRRAAVALGRCGCAPPPAVPRPADSALAADHAPALVPAGQVPSPPAPARAPAARRRPWGDSCPPGQGRAA